MNVKKTKISKKIVLKITMSMTVVLTCYSGRLFDVHMGRVDT